MNSGEYSHLLNPGEFIELDPVEPPSPEWTYGYAYGDIQGSIHTAGNSVLLDIEPKGAVEPLLITGNVSLSVKTLQGTGYAVICNVLGGEEFRVAALDPTEAPLTLTQGDIYCYINASDSDLIVRDDCTPAFQGYEEVAIADHPTARTIDLPNAFWQAYELASNPEAQITPSQQQQFVNAIENLRPILTKSPRPFEPIESDPIDEKELVEVPTLYEFWFTVAGKRAAVTIQESTREFEGKQWSIYVDESPLQIGELAVQKQHTYAISGSEQQRLVSWHDLIYVARNQEGAWEKVPKAHRSSCAMTLERLAGGELTEAEAAANITDYITRRPKSTELSEPNTSMSEPFTLSHFMEVMAILDKVNNAFGPGKSQRHLRLL